MLFSILTFGFLLGLRHATDADHVVAITTISTKQKSIKGSALIGILWGIGHSITVTLVGIPIIFFSLKIPEKLGLALEFSVGIMLVVLGVINLYGLTSRLSASWRIARRIIHKHTHLHLNQEHSHLHIHTKNTTDNNTHHLSLFSMIRPLVIGLIHGLAGSSAIAILILSTINNNFVATLYLIIFHLGVVFGMMIITTLIGTSIKLANKKIEFLLRYLVVGSGVVSFVFGLYIMYQIGFINGLFTSNPIF